MLRVKTLPSLLVLAAMLALAGCGGSGSNVSSSAPTPTPTATPTTSPNGIGTGVSQGLGTSAVVGAANAFLATLNDSQKTVSGLPGSTSTVLFTLTRVNAFQWTNQPGARQGLRLNTATLTAAQLIAAEHLMATALSATGKAGQDEIRRADDVLVSSGGSSANYGSGLYSMAILGTPSTSAPWMLQITGHKLAYNIVYNATYVSGTPTFLGVEPPNWVVTSSDAILVNGSINASTAGTQHAPLEPQRAAVQTLAQAIQSNSGYASAALLSGTFTDIVAGPNGASDSNFGALPYPQTGRGLLYSSLDATTQGYVRAVIEAYVNTMPSDKASTMLSAYESATALASTYVGYAKGAGGTADFGAFPSGTGSQRSYIRIDGPRVWIEFVVQQGVVFTTQVHYHSVWRDKNADYGGLFGDGLIFIL